MKGIHEIDLGQWPQRAYVTNDKRAHNRLMRQKQGDNFRPFPPAHGGHCVMMEQKASGSCLFVIALGEESDRDELACTLAHEATHLMRWLLEHVGEHSPGTETQAYLVESIVRQGLKALA